jgi:hypothetical protein
MNSKLDIKIIYGFSKSIKQALRIIMLKRAAFGDDSLIHVVQ